MSNQNKLTLSMPKRFLEIIKKESGDMELSQSEWLRVVISEWLRRNS